MNKLKLFSATLQQQQQQLCQMRYINFPLSPPNVIRENGCLGTWRSAESFCHFVDI